MSYLANQQVLILKEGSNRNRGKDAQRSNISAARIVSEVVKTTLGPRGMDKMLVDSLGDVTVTSDGATVLDELDVQHPAAKMLVEIAKTQDDEVGDGTTSVVVLAGDLLNRAGKNDDRCSSITYFIVLGLGYLNKHLCSRVLNI